MNDELDKETEEDIKKFLKEHYADGVEFGFKEGLKRGMMGYVIRNKDEYGKFQEIYDKTLEFAVKVNAASFEKFNPPSKLADVEILSRSCSYKIGERAVILYRAVFSLCEDGWASVAPILLRSMVESLLNSYLIIKEHNDYWAFRFFGHGFLNSLVSANEEIAVKQEAQREIDKLLSQLKGDDLTKAKNYIADFIKKGNTKNYWYKPDFKSAQEILPQGLYMVYRYYSESVHSSLLGMGLFKDDGSKISIDPREDKRSIKMTLVQASRILYEITNIRIQHEGLSLKEESGKLLQSMVELKQSMS